MHYFLIRILSLAAALLAICCILSGIPACDKDTILRHYDNALQVGGALARTPDAALQGIRVPGGDSYTGSYTAAYQNFSGREILFGGTALKRPGGRYDHCFLYAKQHRRAGKTSFLLRQQRTQGSTQR